MDEAEGMKGLGGVAGDWILSSRRICGFQSVSHQEVHSEQTLGGGWRQEGLAMGEYLSWTIYSVWQRLMEGMRGARRPGSTVGGLMEADLRVFKRTG